MWRSVIAVIEPLRSLSRARARLPGPAACVRCVRLPLAPGPAACASRACQGAGVCRLRMPRLAARACRLRPPPGTAIRRWHLPAAGVRYTPPKKFCKKFVKNLTNTCKAIIFSRKLRIVFQTRGEKRRAKKGV